VLKWLAWQCALVSRLWTLKRVDPGSSRSRLPLLIAHLS
jgi:hypothetical protein